MQASPVRIAMWSGPRNISTAMMRSFGARADTTVVDEPFYAAYLAATGLEHPMRDEVLASQSTDWREVAAMLLGAVPGGRPIYYQKHMTHHMLPAFGRDWMASVRHGFLIRDPEAVLASYVQARSDVTLEDIGIVQQREIFERQADGQGVAPPVVEGEDVLRAPKAVLSRLCVALDIVYSDTMLQWAPGRHSTDGVWAPAWYAAVERSTGFGPPSSRVRGPLPAALLRIADAARPHYDVLARHRLQATTT